MRAQLLIRAALWTLVAGVKIFGAPEAPAEEVAPIAAAESDDAPALAQAD